MTRLVVLDTNALIRLFKGTGREIERALMSCSRLVIPLVSYGEFLDGIERGIGGAAERRLLEDLLATPDTEVHHPTEDTARFYAKILNQLRRQGTPIPTNDIWIAAETMALGGTLYSYNRHFHQVPILNWVDCNEGEM